MLILESAINLKQLEREAMSEQKTTSNETPQVNTFWSEFLIDFTKRFISFQRKVGKDKYTDHPNKWGHVAFILTKVDQLIAEAEENSNSEQSDMTH